MFFQICNLVDRRKENKCRNKTENKAKGEPPQIALLLGE
jgi:hypothetical protein